MATAGSIIRSRIEEAKKVRDGRGFSTTKFFKVNRALKSYVDAYPFCNKQELKGLLNQKFNLLNHWHLDSEISKFDDIFSHLKNGADDVLVKHYDKAHSKLQGFKDLNVDYRDSMKRLKMAISDVSPLEFLEAYDRFDTVQGELIGFHEMMEEVSGIGSLNVHAVGFDILSRMNIDVHDIDMMEYLRKGL